MCGLTAHRGFESRSLRQTVQDIADPAALTLGHAEDILASGTTIALQKSFFRSAGGGYDRITPNMDDRLPADVALVRRLIESQFPQWTCLDIRPVEAQGWDHHTFRLGDEMKVRLPSAARYASQPGKEHQWLPHLARHLRLAVPQPVAIGAPGLHWPWVWSVQRWLPGDPLTLATEAIARDLGAFLRDLWATPTADGPEADAHSFHRGGRLQVYDDQTRSAIQAAGERVDLAMAIWTAALAAQGPAESVWVHGDLAAGNLLLNQGRLSAVIDWGLCAVGDPACDLVPAWTIFDTSARAVFRDSLEAEPKLWLRARGWALWKSLIVLAAGEGGAQVTHARRTLDALMSDAILQ